METVRPVADRLQGFAPEPPSCLALGGRIRLGTSTPRWCALVPNVAQFVTWLRRPKADKLQTTDVSGKVATL